MRIMILANDSVGIMRFRSELISSLKSAGHEILLNLPPDDNALQLENLGAKVLANKHLERRGKNPIQDIILVGHYVCSLYRMRPDVVFTYTIKPNVYGGIACQLLHIPYVSNVTGLGTSIQQSGPIQKLALFLYRIGLQGARKVFFQNTANKTFMQKHGVLRGYNGADVPCEVLPGSGVNVKHFGMEPYGISSEENQIIFLTAGRIMRDKGTGVLIDAAREVKHNHPEVRFLLVGSFDEDWKQVIADAMNEDTVEYHQYQPDLRPYYSLCHALVHPSFHEGMSNVCLEAASTARPIIASDVPGCRETFDEGISGIGFKPRSVESLVEALEHFIALPWEERRAMGLAGRKKVVREFDRRIVVERYFNEIEKIIQG